jgi:serine O-acetyltransferase
VCSDFKQDLARYFQDDGVSARTIFKAFFEMGLWAVAIYRFGQACRRVRFRPLRLCALAVYFFLYKISEALSGVQISANAEIGPGLIIHNIGGIYLRGKIGRNCTVMPGVQLVSRANGRGEGWPTIGDDVLLGVGAKVLGEVRVGNHARVGANVVVTRDVPDWATVVPAEAVVRMPKRPIGEAEAGERPAEPPTPEA